MRETQLMKSFNKELKTVDKGLRNKNAIDISSDLDDEIPTKPESVQNITSPLIKTSAKKIRTQKSFAASL